MQYVFPTTQFQIELKEMNQLSPQNTFYISFLLSPKPFKFLVLLEQTYTIIVTSLYWMVAHWIGEQSKKILK